MENKYDMRNYMPIVEKKEGSLIGLVKGYLDSKKFDHSLIKSIEPKRLVIGIRKRLI